MLESRGEHMYRKSGGTKVNRNETIFCVYGCRCYKDAHGFGGPDGIDPEGKCPKAPVGSRLELMLAAPTSHL